jgi:hypothetical protein
MTAATTGTVLKNIIKIMQIKLPLSTHPEVKNWQNFFYLYLFIAYDNFVFSPINFRNIWRQKM